MQKLIPEDNHILPQRFQFFRHGRQRIFDGLHQLFDRSFQFPEQRIVHLDLPVDLTAVSDDAFLFQRTGNDTLVDRRLLIQASLRMAAVVDPGICTGPLQMGIGVICPCLAPDKYLFIAVPFFCDGVLSAVLGAFRVFVGSFISVLLSLRWRHIHFFSTNLVRILLLPSVSLCRLKLSGGKAPFLAVSDTEIFFLGFILPVALLIKRAHRQHDVGVRIMTGRVRIVDILILIMMQIN